VVGSLRRAAARTPNQTTLLCQKQWVRAPDRIVSVGVNARPHPKHLQKMSLMRLNTASNRIHELIRRRSTLTLKELLFEAHEMEIGQANAREIVDDLANLGKIYRPRPGVVEWVDV